MTAFGSDRDGVGAPIGAVRGTSVAEGLRASLAQRILALELPPGTALTEQSLAVRYDVSRNTVREALRLLADDGLVRHHRHRGAVVARPSPADLADLYAARRAVETAAAWSISRADADALTAMGAAVDRMRGAAAAGDGRAVAEADLGFHAAMVAVVASDRLDRFMGSLCSELRLALIALDRARPEPGKADEHQRLLDLAEAGDAAALADAVAAHLDVAAAQAQAVFDRTG